jgi:predicted O-methyltransferase YrrM
MALPLNFVDRLASQTIRPPAAIGCASNGVPVRTVEHVLTHPAATITCVDPWGDRKMERRFDRNVAASGKSEQLVKRKGPSWRELRELPPGWFTFVHIDGCHEGLNVLEDAVLSFRLLRPGGLLCFDDYLWQNDQRGHLPREAIDAFLGLYDRQIEVLDRGYQVWRRGGR